MQCHAIPGTIAWYGMEMGMELGMEMGMKMEMLSSWGVWGKRGVLRGKVERRTFFSLFSV